MQASKALKTMKTKKSYRGRVCALLICLFTVTSGPAASADSIKWYPYDEGMAVGKIEKKKVFLHFYANWCFYCRKMAQKTFQDASVVAYLNDHFIPIRVDSDKDRKTSAKYGVRGLPSNWFFMETGESLGNLPGYVPPSQFLSILEQIRPLKDVPGKK